MIILCVPTSKSIISVLSLLRLCLPLLHHNLNAAKFLLNRNSSPKRFPTETVIPMTIKTRMHRSVCSDTIQSRCISFRTGWFTNVLCCEFLLEIMLTQLVCNFVNRNCPSEDAPFIPTTPTCVALNLRVAPMLSSEDEDEEVGSGINPLYLTADSPTRLTSPSPDLRPMRFTSRPRAPKRRLDTVKDLLDDDEDKDDDRDPTDDEYCPSPPLPARKKTRASGHARRAASRGKRAPRSTSSKPTRVMPQSRNSQSTSPAFLKVVNKKRVRSCDFICPECGFEQENKRMPDYQRHLRTHARPSDEDQSRGWWCKGVPVEERYNYAIPAEAKTYYFQDRQRIGGCRLTFSRRDALKRHLDNPNVSCVGSPSLANDD
ncbi:hypothetical protein E1B28_012302 [Marasmius oreades]|uniref:C2H2-type domain-containing protein n=1 Tax=Marasmius oreades TaxID=181124 RepID=A0A9P7RRC8_9AGAR|nr:uncharacterized protein E1B28_012302 [Marasmius oreades]KAG7088290.1 hypothetical protein E1B28_012302 [Marasmius oreades]